MRILKETWRIFRLHEGSLLAAAIAFYALLALAPLGVLGLAVAAWVLGEDAARGELAAQLAVLFDADTAAFVSDMILRASERSSRWWAPLLSVVFLLFVSTRLFWMLRAAINHLWGVRSTQPPGFRGLAGQVLRRRLLAFSMVFFLAVAVVATTAVKAILSAARDLLGGYAILYDAASSLATVAVLAALFTLVFKLLPDARIETRDAWLGATITAAGATAGSLVIGRWVAIVSAGSTFGAAGSLVIVLLWVYYTAQIFFLGAIFTAAWSRHRGRGVEPLPHADRVVLEAESSSNDPSGALSDRWRHDLKALGEGTQNRR